MKIYWCCALQTHWQVASSVNEKSTQFITVCRRHQDFELWWTKIFREHRKGKKKIKHAHYTVKYPNIYVTEKTA